MYGDELSFKEGDQIEILSTDDPNWYRGKLKGRFGFVPSNYLSDFQPDKRASV